MTSLRLKITSETICNYECIIAEILMFQRKSLLFKPNIFPFTQREGWGIGKCLGEERNFGLLFTGNQTKRKQEGEVW